MQFGRFEVTSHVLGRFRLDGGAMFGSVPKNIWAKRITPDAENCIPLSTRSLVIRADNRVFLTDVGMGEKWNEKQRVIYAIQNVAPDQYGFNVEEVTDVILTHLHFDHAGGISRYVSGNAGTVELCYPNAQVHLQADNWDNARKPTLKERASYLKENVFILEQAKLNLVDGNVEIFPDLWVHKVSGHTRGQQVIELRAGERSMFFMTDLVPTYRHLPVPFHMGYDAWAERVLDEKTEYLGRIFKTGSIVAFQHDPDIAACTLKVDEQGHFGVGEVVTLDGKVGDFSS